MKIEKTLYIVGGTIGGLVLTYFGYSLWRANKNKKLAERGERLETGSTTGSTDDNTQSSDARKESRDSFPMRAGAFGYKVSLLQSALNKLGASLTVDGKYGQKTYDAVGEHGGLPWYQWNALCKLQAVEMCYLAKTDYEDILAEATKQGWKKEQAEGIASETWKEFVNNGDDWAYNNLRM